MTLRVRFRDTTVEIGEPVGDESLCATLVRAGVPLKMECGGVGTCGTCSVRIADCAVLYHGAAIRIPAGEAWTVRTCQTRLAAADADIEVAPGSLPD